MIKAENKTKKKLNVNDVSGKWLPHMKKYTRFNDLTKNEKRKFWEAFNDSSMITDQIKLIDVSIKKRVQ